MTEEQAVAVIVNDLESRGYGVTVETDEGLQVVRFSHKSQNIGAVHVPAGITVISDEQALGVLNTAVLDAVYAARNEPILRPR